MSIYYLRDECETHLKAKALMYNSFLSSRPSLRPACISNLGGDILLNIDIQPGIRKLNNTVRGLTRLLLFVMGDIPPWLWDGWSFEPPQTRQYTIHQEPGHELYSSESITIRQYDGPVSSARVVDGGVMVMRSARVHNMCIMSVLQSPVSQARAVGTLKTSPSIITEQSSSAAHGEIFFCSVLSSLLSFGSIFGVCEIVALVAALQRDSGKNLVAWGSMQ